ALGLSDYVAVLESFLSLAPVRPRRGAHPRLAILGLLEARMVDADLTILGGLNEGVWPGIAETGPWLNRPQLRKLGLPLPERRIGLAAHDFAQAFARPRIVLSLSRKIGTSPAVPSRWIMRLKALRQAVGARDAEAPPWSAWVRALDHPQAVRPVPRPAVKPPLDLRPKAMSVTRLEELMRDPYAAFARHVLKVRPLDRLGEVAGVLERGNIVHRMVQEFTRLHPGALPPDAEALIMAEAEKAFAAFGIGGAQAAFWRPQLRRIARWFLEHEEEARRDVDAHFVEIEGSTEFPVAGEAFRLTARADRIDRLRDGSLRILDYKTGALPSFDAKAAGFSPQLLLEAQIARQGGFAGIGRGEASAVAYMRLSGGTPAGEHKPCEKDLDARIEETAEGLALLLLAYADPEMPYEARDWSGEPDGERDFGHLSRWREWSLGGVPGDPE
ncbi:MAG: PD-(D/E)XK nuclease family protein, partial [Parvibaculaceae bacterium]